MFPWAFYIQWVPVWIEKLFEATIKPTTIEKKAERQRAKDFPTNVRKKTEPDSETTAELVDLGGKRAGREFIVGFDLVIELILYQLRQRHRTNSSRVGFSGCIDNRSNLVLDFSRIDI